jgi:hypothetical protein
VKDVINKFKNDERIFIWDLYNEPSSSGLGSRSIPLVNKVVVWAREINPTQPLTLGIWNDYEELNRIVEENADVISFHCYASKEETEKRIAQMKQYNRPLICSEWMNRVANSTVEDIMPLLKTEKTGSILWGLINGKTQTDLPWGFRPENLPYTGRWQHDLFHTDFTPYMEEELDIIKILNKK